MDHLQIAQGLKDAVDQWCFPVTSGPPPRACSPEDGRGGGPAAGSLDFLHALLNLEGLSAAVPEHQVPFSLQDEPHGLHDWRAHTGPAWDAFTPLSSSGASTFRSSTPGGPPFTARSGGGGPLQRAAAEHAYNASQEPLKEPAPNVTVEAPLSITSPPQSELFLSVEAEEDVHAGGAAPRTPPALLSAAKPQARRRAAAPAAPSAAAAAAAPTSAAHPRQQQQQQQQRQQVFGRQARTSAASALAAKSGKRRPEPGVGREAQPAVHTDAATAAPEGAPVGAPSVRGKGAPVSAPSMRAEGPPQKRQAVARQRGETPPAVTRSNSSTTSSSSSSSNNNSGLGGKAAAAAGRGALASRRGVAAVSGASSSAGPQGRQKTSSSSQPLTRPKQQPSKQQQQQQQKEGLSASEADDFSLHAQRYGSLDLGGDEAAADAAAAAAAAIRSSSSSSSSTEGAVSAFAAQWLLRCEKRLRASSSGGPSPSAAAAAGGGAAETLLLTKKRLKQELKDYNAAFACRFGRQPLKEDKEPLRPLYMHYQQLKQQIEGELLTPQGETERDLRNNGASSPPAAPAAPAAAAAAAVGGGVVRSSSSLSGLRQMGESERGAGNLRSSRSQGSRETLVSPGFSSSRSSSRRRHAGGAPSEGSKQLQRSRSSSNSSSSSSNWQRLSAYEWQQQMQQRRAAMTEELHALQRERRLLGDKLAAYHSHFREKHGRQLRLKADIIPVQQEYNSYVELTQQIERLALELQQQTL
ncbi:hypothetical protein Emed_004418 [Eimeria media]